VKVKKIATTHHVLNPDVYISNDIHMGSNFQVCFTCTVWYDEQNWKSYTIV